LLIKCWGSRGSIPVCGKEFLKYGGDTTCLEIRTKENEIIIVDTGTGIRKLGNSIINKKFRHFNIILTHAHIDHLWGFPFFKPIYNKKSKIKIYGCPFAQKTLQKILSDSIGPPYFPLSFDKIEAEISFEDACENEFSLHSLRITPIRLSHPNMGSGYKFVDNGKSFVFLTDNELTFKHPGGLDYKDYLEFSRDVDLLIHDAEFTDKEYGITKSWGHSRYTDALKLALEAQVKQFGLFHHNQNRTDSELDKMVESCQNIINNQQSDLKCFAVKSEMEINL
jgi:phosphoribosyl 1,2-cyclic phosphodiesterase